MKLSRKGSVVTFAAGILMLGAMALPGQSSAEQYEATFYVAGMGGHFAKVEAVIDPSQKQPIKVNSLTKIDIGDGHTHPVHDARIDANDRNTMFWSTYKIDSETNKTHVGKTDLNTGKKIADMDVDVPDWATQTKSMYCASAQAKDYFLPISMSNKGYIDVFNKADLGFVRRVALEGTEADIHKPYKFYHGTNSPDMKKLLITINEADKDHGTTIGKLHLVQVDMDKFVKGEVKVINKTVLPGAEKKTVSFRQYYSPDGKLIANATGDRMFVVKADDLDLVDAEMMDVLEETHDAIFTPDSKYIIATSRTKNILEGCQDPKAPKEGEFLMDGHLKLYDVAAKKWVGTSTSVCLACHNEEGLDVHAVLCGLDANWKSM